jgi:hypothetical protein
MTPAWLERPVLVGGTGRSGTTIAGQLLHHHPALALTTPAELRFLTGNEGVVRTLAAQAEGGAVARAARDRLTRRLRGRFYRWSKPSGVEEGLHRTVDQATLDAAVEEYLARAETDPVEAARGLIFAIVPSTLRRHQGSRWVDTTPSNVQCTQLLHELLPEARFLHMMRDGRDVAVSFASQKFGPDDPIEALDMWGERMVGASMQQSLVPEGIVLRVDLADWAGASGLTSLHKICDFLEVGEDAGLDAWFSTNVTSASMHQGRWRAELSRRKASTLDRRYEHWCAVLTERFPQFPLPRSS